MATLDRSKLTEDQLTQVEDFRLKRKTLETLEDLAKIVQSSIDVVEDIKQDGSKNTKGLGALLTDIRESLNALKDKEAPSQPDYAKPVVQAVSKLEKALTASMKAIDVKPEVKLNAPPVNVSVPDVDLKGVEKVLKTDLPKAFNKAITSIPKTEIPETDFEPLTERLDTMVDWLKSIDTASRLKPQFPTTVKVTNPDGTAIGTFSNEETYTAVRLDDTTTANVTYIGKAATGSSAASAVWQIAKLDTSSGLIKTWADGDASFNNVWNDRASLSYS